MSDVKVCPQCGREVTDGSRFCPVDGAPLRPRGGQETADLVGTMVADRFLVLRTLGEGGMGRVYLAEHVRMGRKCALKVMSPRMASDPDAISRFNREAANACRINHPNVAAVYDFGETGDGVIYLAMEYVEGAPLTAIVEREGALPPLRAASIAMQTAEALAAAHDLGIVHRDLKPDNIMIARGRDGGDLVKVVDFGIAKMADDDAQKVTKTGLVVGTPEYMSPEQLAGDRLDGRSDIYSLALVAFNMLTGALPFPADSQQEAMIMRLTDRPRRLAEMLSSVEWTEELQAVFDKALARNASDRYATAVELGRDLVTGIERLPASAGLMAGTQLLEPANVPAPRPPAPIAGRTAPPPRAREGTGVLPTTLSAPVGVEGGAARPVTTEKRAIPLWAAAAIAIVVIAGAGAAVYMGGGSGSTDSTGVTSRGQTTSPLSNPIMSIPTDTASVLPPADVVFAEVERLTRVAEPPDTEADRRNAATALARLETVMPRLTARSDSAYARFLQAEAHLMRLEANEGCRILRRLVPSDLNASRQKALRAYLDGPCS